MLKFLPCCLTFSGLDHPRECQQGLNKADLLGAAYASHGDTRHPLLFPATPKESFDFAALALDLADRLQTPIIVMSDLELGMNDTLSDPFEWDDSREYDRGKVLTKEDLDALSEFGRYVDVDGDGIGYRTFPGMHPDKGSFFTRGTSRDAYARYTEDPDTYIANMDRLLLKWETARALMPAAEVHSKGSNIGCIYYGSTAVPMQEAHDLLAEAGASYGYDESSCFPFWWRG